jgi:hypothetical protein
MAKNKANVLTIQDDECMGLKLNDPINPTKPTPSLTMEVINHIELNKLLPLQVGNMSKDHIVTIPIDMLAKLLTRNNFIQGEPCNIEDKVNKNKPLKAFTYNLGVKTQK